MLVAPDSFKGTFSASEVADAVARGIEAAELVVDRCPVADGGEGTRDVLVDALGGELIEVPTHDPLGREIRAQIGFLPDGDTAVIDTASASGLTYLSSADLDPWAASTWGTGHLIATALGAGARRVLNGVGGTATVDGGRGALSALREVAGLVRGRSVVVLCDVETGWRSCAEIYGPQKGADPEMVDRLATRLDRLAAELPRDPRRVPMTGAGGGLSGGLWAGLEAKLVPGARYVLNLLAFDARLGETDAVVAGEGQIDVQSVMGKCLGEIADRARRAKVAVHAVAGRNALKRDLGRAIGLRSVTEASSLDELEEAGWRLAVAVGGEFSCQ